MFLTKKRESAAASTQKLNHCCVETIKCDHDFCGLIPDSAPFTRKRRAGRLICRGVIRWESYAECHTLSVCGLKHANSLAKSSACRHLWQHSWKSSDKTTVLTTPVNGVAGNCFVREDSWHQFPQTDQHLPLRFDHHVGSGLIQAAFLMSAIEPNQCDPSLVQIPNLA